MAYMSYADLTIGTIAGVGTKIGSPSLALQLTQGSPSVDVAVQAVLDDTKVNALANALDVHFKTIMPDTIGRWINQRQEWFHAWNRRANLDTLPVSGFYGGADFGAGVAWLLTGQTFRQADDIGIVEPPFTWFFVGPVVNGSGTTATLRTIANNGDRAYDTLNNILFINRGTSAAVNWQIQSYEDVKDYLINPSVLSEAHNYLAAAKCFELGLSRLVVSYSDATRRDYLMEREAYCMSKFLDALYGNGDEKGRRTGNGVLKLLQTDYSNSGSYTEFSREITPEDVWTV